MASKYKRPGSAYWWINYKDPADRLIKRKSTGFKIGVGADTRRADEMVAQWTLKERQCHGTTADEAWVKWVTDFINDPKHKFSHRTTERYLTGWRVLRMFLEEREVAIPRQLTYQNCSDYLDWRMKPDKRKGKYKAGTNTAILEFKLLRWLMREAVRRGYSSGNIAREVVLKRDKAKIFPDYTDEELQAIWKAIGEEPEPMRTCFQRSFAIALLQGVRLNETNVHPMKHVSLNVVSFKGHAAPVSTITFIQKGDRERVKPLHPQLVPLFTKLQSKKAGETYPLERFTQGINKGRLKWGNRWTKFFVRHGFKETNPNGCFHSLRVTVENVLREADIAKEVREYYLTHEHESDDDVNAGYDRVKVREMLACHEPLNRPWLEV